MATRAGIVKKTPLSAYSRPQKGGIIAIKLDEGDELIDVVIVTPGQDLLLATANGMAIRFSHDDVRSMGRNTRGVKGIKLKSGDHVVGMVVADPEKDLLSVCEKGFGKRTPFGPPEAESGEAPEVSGLPAVAAVAASDTDLDDAEVDEIDEPDIPEEEENEEEAIRSGMHYRRQRRGGKGLRNIRTSERNGLVIDVISVSNDDEVLMVTALGKIQRVRARDISEIGRNTQGVTIIRLDEGDSLVSMACVSCNELQDEAVAPPSPETPA
jgi:DNA gyrase subunit A